jgi:hypothetical protein
MSDETPQLAEVVKLDTEAVLLTSEGRTFLNQLTCVSRIITISNTTVTFKGKEVMKTGYWGDYKSVQLFECPQGYFLFCNKLFSKNNWSAAASDLDTLFQQITDRALADRIQQELSQRAPA